MSPVHYHHPRFQPNKEPFVRMITSCYWCTLIEPQYLKAVCVANQNLSSPADKTGGTITIHPSDKKQMLVMGRDSNGHTHIHRCTLVWIQHVCGKTKLSLWFVWKQQTHCIYDLFKQPWLVTIIIILTKLQSWFLPVCFTMPVFVHTGSAVGRMLWETWLCKTGIKQTTRNERSSSIKSLV